MKTTKGKDSRKRGAMRDHKGKKKKKEAKREKRNKENETTGERRAQDTKTKRRKKTKGMYSARWEEEDKRR